MNTINDSNTVKSQYGNSSNLSSRISIHEKYSVNKQGFGNWIFANYEIAQGMKVLELGCGTGSMWDGKKDYIGRCSELVLSDFSEGMLNKTRENLAVYEGITFKVIDIQDIPFEDETFDVVIANMMLYHVPDLDKGLTEVKRVLRKGGTFYCATYGEHGIMEYLTSLFSGYNVTDNTNKNFTLQNGSKILGKFFENVNIKFYEDSLAVTEPEDLADYILSLGSMTSLGAIPGEKITEVLYSHMENGVINIPKEYGMFICK